MDTLKRKRSRCSATHSEENVSDKDMAGAGDKPAAAKRSRKTKKVTFTSPLTQKELEDFAASARGEATTHLTIQAEAGESPMIDFGTVSLPNLDSLHVSCQAVKALNFQAKDYPRLKRLNMENLMDEVKSISFHLPLLETVSLRFVNVGDPRGLGKSLSRSPKLKGFSSHKLWGLDMGSKHHTLALPNCELLQFIRSDCLSRLKLWAPRLRTLNLQSCYDLDEVVILDNKPKGYTGKDYTFHGQPTPYVVDIQNLCERPEGNVLTHSRCALVVGEPCSGEEDFDMF